jgi:hypothetical protein
MAALDVRSTGCIACNVQTRDGRRLRPADNIERDRLMCVVAETVASVQRVAEQRGWLNKSQRGQQASQHSALRAATGGTTPFYPKLITDLGNGVEKRRSGREVQRSTFASFLGSLDFRLLQQYRHETDLQRCPS